MVAQAALIAAGINFASGFLKGKQEEYEAKVQAKLALNNAANLPQKRGKGAAERFVERGYDAQPETGGCGIGSRGGGRSGHGRKPDDNDGAGNDFGSFGTEYP